MPKSTIRAIRHRRTNGSTIKKKRSFALKIRFIRVRSLKLAQTDPKTNILIFTNTYFVNFFEKRVYSIIKIHKTSQKIHKN